MLNVPQFALLVIGSLGSLADTVLEVLGLITAIVPDEAGEAVLLAFFLLTLLNPFVRVDDADDSVCLIVGALLHPALINLTVRLPFFDLDRVIDFDWVSAVQG